MRKTTKTKTYLRLMREQYGLFVRLELMIKYASSASCAANRRTTKMRRRSSE